MKNATKHADNLKSLHKKLLKEGKPEAKTTIEPLRALVLGVLSEAAPDAKAEAAMAVIDKEFVDLNELRVATELEVVQIIGPRYPGIERKALMFREILNAIFEKEHTLSFDRIKTLGKKDIRALLKELPEMTPFVEGYTLQHGLDVSAFPLDESMLESLVEADVVEEGTSLDDAQKFVEGHLKADEYYEFYSVLRRAVTLKKVGK